MTLLTAGALTDTQLPVTASNVCTTDGGVVSAGIVSPNKNHGYAGGLSMLKNEEPNSVVKIGIIYCEFTLPLFYRTVSAFVWQVNKDQEPVVMSIDDENKTFPPSGFDLCAVMRDQPATKLIIHFVVYVLASCAGCECIIYLLVLALSK